MVSSSNKIAKFCVNTLYYRILQDHYFLAVIWVGTPFVYLESIEALKKGHSRKIVDSPSCNG